MKPSRREFITRETKFHGRYSAELVDTLKQAYRPFYNLILLSIALGFLGRLVILANANLIGYWVDSLCVSGAAVPCRPVPSVFQGLGTQGFLTLMSAATLFGFATTLVFRIGVSRLSAEAVGRIYDETTLRTSRFPMAFFDRNPAGRVMTRFSSDYNTIFRIFGGPLAEFLTLIFDLIAMTVLIGVASPWFLPVWALLFVMNYGVYRLNLPALRLERREVARNRSPGIAHFAETAQGAATVRAFGRTGVFQNRFAELSDAYLDRRLKLSAVLARFAFSMNGVTAFAFLLTGVFSISLVNSGRVGVGAVGVAFTYLGLSTNVLQSIFEWLAQFEEAMTGLERMNEYVRLPLEPGAKLPSNASIRTGHAQHTHIEEAALTPKVDKVGASIVIRDLWMRYREDLPPVLQGVDLAVKPGERLAVVGKTGSGKSSLIQALFRLYPIERGSISVGGVEANTDGNQNGCDILSYRHRLAYITQEPTLFIGSLRENLLGAGTPPKRDRDALLIEALRQVQLLSPGASDTEYNQWLEYNIEERGLNLSAGERQLICMARCLLQGAPVVVLDEATSAVDPRSEEILTRATDEIFRGRTQIIIAHRLSTVRSCDRVLWLQRGRVHRLGTPAQVLGEFEGAELQI